MADLKDKKVQSLSIEEMATPMALDLTAVFSLIKEEVLLLLEEDLTAEELQGKLQELLT